MLRGLLADEPQPPPTCCARMASAPATSACSIRRRSTADRRSQEGHRHHRRRQECQPKPDRDHAEVEPLYQRSERDRRRPQVSHRPDRARCRHRVGMGARQEASPIRATARSRPIARSIELSTRGASAPTRQLGRVEQVKAFRILDRELDPEARGRGGDRHPQDQALAAATTFRPSDQSRCTADDEEQRISRQSALKQFDMLSVRGMERQMKSMTRWKAACARGARRRRRPACSTRHRPSRRSRSAFRAPRPDRHRRTISPHIEGFRIYRAASSTTSGGVNGSKIEFIVLDDKAAPSEAATNAKRLMDDEQVLAVGQMSLSSTYAPMFQAAARTKTPTSAARPWRCARPTHHAADESLRLLRRQHVRSQHCAALAGAAGEGARPTRTRTS